MANKRELLDEGPAAEHISMSVAFLRSGRLRGVIGNRTPPPAYLKIGRKIKYDVKDLDDWLQARRIDPAERKARVARGATAA